MFRLNEKYVAKDTINKRDESIDESSGAREASGPTQSSAFRPKPVLFRPVTVGQLGAASEIQCKWARFHDFILAAKQRSTT